MPEPLEMRDDLASFYAPLVLKEVPRLLGQMDRQPFSPTVGSFDRDWWAWKFRDFPLTMLQAGLLPLAQLWAHPFPGSSYYRNQALAGWIESGVTYSLKRQRPNGSFDSLGPNTQDHGVTLMMVYLLCRCQSLTGEAWPEAFRERVVEAVLRACRFAERSSEDYAFVSNHRALFALAWLEASMLTSDREYRRQADAEITAVLHHQSTEGWYSEYGGADPGYESLGIYYLSRVWHQTRDATLMASLRRSVAFFTYTVHPDGSVGGGYGSRVTALYAPGGFELLAAHNPDAGAVASFLRPRLTQSNVLTPAIADAMNLPILLSSYLDACFVDPAKTSVPALPCEGSSGMRRFEAAGLTTFATPRYYAVFSAARGGVMRVFDRENGTLAYQDGGYVVAGRSGVWTSQGKAHSLPCDDGETASESRFAEYRPLTQTPSRFLVLRLLQLTVFRSRRLGAWLRRRIVSRLITARRSGPFRFVRRVRFHDDQLDIHDRIVREGTVRARQVALVPTFTPMHMGSARYYHPSDLAAGPEVLKVDITSVLNATGVVERRFLVVFAHDGSVRIEEPGSDSQVD